MSEDDTRPGKSFVAGLKTEWSLFWHSIVGDDQQPESIDPFYDDEFNKLDLQQLKKLNKSLSDGKKQLNQRLESLNKELDLNIAKIESLRLVSGDPSYTEEKINELTDLGQKLSQQLMKIDEKIRYIRQREEDIRNSAEI